MMLRGLRAAAAKKSSVCPPLFWTKNLLAAPSCKQPFKPALVALASRRAMSTLNKDDDKVHNKGRLSHDVGGDLTLFGGPIQNIKASDKPEEEGGAALQAWEQQCHALMAVLGSKQILSSDQLRFAIEGLTQSQYTTWTYYEKWSAAMTTILLDQGMITHDELRLALFGPEQPQSSDKMPAARFQSGDLVRVLDYKNKGGIEWRRPHIKTPGYIYGVVGTVQDVCGTFGDPSFKCLGLEAPQVWLYRVSFQMKDLWPEHESSMSKDVVSVEVYEQWLESTSATGGHAFENIMLFDHKDDGRDCAHAHQDHDHDSHHDHDAHHETHQDHHDHDSHHDHDHDTHHEHEPHHSDDHSGDHSHDPRPSVEERAVRVEGPPRPGKELHKALMNILLDRNIVTEAEVRKMSEGLDTAGENLTGASLVVQAWLDLDFQKRLLLDPTKAALEIGINTSNPNAPTVLSVVQNTPNVHNLVVCTLCSCYPSGLLGIAPSWYKSSEFRARAVREPRTILKEFGTTVLEKSIQVHDSTADHRYLVLPERPEGTEGWSAEELRALVTRDCMIGVTIPKVE
jgi:nitrile hydratase